MSNRLQIERKDKTLGKRAQHDALGEAGAIFFHTLYEDIREKQFDDAVSEFEGL